MTSPQLHSAASRSETLVRKEDVQHLQGDVSEPFEPNQTLNIQQGYLQRGCFLILCCVLLGHVPGGDSPAPPCPGCSSVAGPWAFDPAVGLMNMQYFQ